MTALRFFSSDDPNHRDVTALLPWYVNGTLEALERARVDEHLGQCVACRHELEEQRAVGALVRSDTVAPALAHALERIHAQIDALRPAPAANARRPWWQRPALIAPLVGAQFAVIVVLLLVMLQPPPPAPFHTLSNAPPVTTSGDAVVVVFDDAVPQQRVRELLRGLDARIVDGPNSRGAFTLELPPDHQPDALARLRAAPEVRFAQPAPGSFGTMP